MQFFATLTIVFYCVPRCVSVLQFARPDLCSIHFSVRRRLRQQWFSEIWRLWRGIENERKMLRLRRLRRRRMLMLQAAFLASMNLKRSSSSLSNVLHSCKVCQLHLYTAYKTFVDVWVWMRSWNFWSFLRIDVSADFWNSHGLTSLRDFCQPSMEDVEERALATAETLPRFWKCYVHDTRTVLPSHCIDELLSHLNTVETSI